MKRMLIYLRFVFLCTIISSSIVSCTKDDDKSGPVPKKVVFNPTSLNMIIGDSEAIIATVEPALSDPIKSVITWSSTDDKIVSVLNGMVSAVSVGEATIKAVTANGIECVCNVKVDAKPIFAVGLNITSKKVVIEESKTFNLDYDITPFDANRNKDIIWQSSDEAVATVKDGIITAVAKGSAIIKGSFKNGVSAKINIVVERLPYVISPDMVGTLKCVKLQARYSDTGKIFEEKNMHELFGWAPGEETEKWCKEIKDGFSVKTTSNNQIIWPVKLDGGRVRNVTGDITRDEYLDDVFFVNYHIGEIGITFHARSGIYNRLKFTWLPETKQVIYDEPSGLKFDFIYTCDIVKDEAVKMSTISLEKLESLKCVK